MLAHRNLRFKQDKKKKLDFLQFKNNYNGIDQKWQYEHKAGSEKFLLYVRDSTVRTDIIFG